MKFEASTDAAQSDVCLDLDAQPGSLWRILRPVAAAGGRSLLPAGSVCLVLHRTGLKVTVLSGCETVVLYVGAFDPARKASVRML
jgi:hypothetical protein